MSRDKLTGHEALIAFTSRHLCRAVGNRLSMRDVLEAYERFCSATEDVAPLPRSAFVQMFAEACGKIGFALEVQGKSVFAVGVGLKPVPAALPKPRVPSATAPAPLMIPPPKIKPPRAPDTWVDRGPRPMPDAGLPVAARARISLLDTFLAGTAAVTGLALLVMR